MQCGSILEVVVDTNVFIRGLFHGDQHARRVLSLMAGGRLCLLITDAIEEEILLAVLAHVIEAGLTFERARPTLRKLIRLLQKGRRISELAPFTHCEDPDDNKFFECAIAGGAKCIISYNCHVTGIEAPPVPVMSPWQLLCLYFR